MATKLTRFGQLPCLILPHNIALSFAVLGALLVIPFSDCSVILSNHTVHFILLFKILKTFFLLQPTLIKIWLALLIFPPFFFSWPCWYCTFKASILLFNPWSLDHIALTNPHYLIINCLTFYIQSPMSLTLLSLIGDPAECHATEEMMKYTRNVTSYDQSKRTSFIKPRYI